MDEVWTMYRQEEKYNFYDMMYSVHKISVHSECQVIFYNFYNCKTLYTPCIQPYFIIHGYLIYSTYSYMKRKGTLKKFLVTKIERRLFLI